MEGTGPTLVLLGFCLAQSLGRELTVELSKAGGKAAELHQVRLELLDNEPGLRVELRSPEHYNQSA